MIKLTMENNKKLLPLYSAIITGVGRPVFKKMQGKELRNFIEGDFEVIGLDAEFGESYVFVKNDVYDDDFFSIDVLEDIINDSIEKAKIELEKRNSEIENEYRNKPERNIDIKKYYIYFGSPRFNFREFESLESLMEKAESTINKARNIMQSEEFSDFEKYISIGVNYTLSEGYQGSRDIVNNVSLDGIESNTFNWSRDIFTEKLVLDDESVKKLKDLIDILNS